MKEIDRGTFGEDLVHRERTAAALYPSKRPTHSLETIPRKRLERAEALAAPDLWRSEGYTGFSDFVL